MKSPLNYDNYREYLNYLMYGEDATRGAQAKLALAMGCQASYLLQVSKNKAELTEDHTVALSNYLELKEAEIEYLLLLVRISRAATSDLKKFLENKRKKILSQESELSNKVKSKSLVDKESFLSHYFSSWIPSTLHVSTSSKKYQTIESLSARLNLPQEIVQKELEFLEVHGLVNRVGKNFEFAGGSIHLPRKSNLNETHQVIRRIQAFEKHPASQGPRSALFFNLYPRQKFLSDHP